MTGLQIATTTGLAIMIVGCVYSFLKASPLAQGAKVVYAAVGIASVAALVWTLAL